MIRRASTPDTKARRAAALHPHFRLLICATLGAVAVTAQTSHAAVSTRPMRRLVLAQSILSFAFNTAILAFSINAAAGFF